MLNNNYLNDYNKMVEELNLCKKELEIAKYNLNLTHKLHEEENSLSESDQEKRWKYWRHRSGMLNSELIDLKQMLEGIINDNIIIKKALKLVYNELKKYRHLDVDENYFIEKVKNEL